MDDTERRRVTQLIASRMAARGWSQERLAEAADVAPNTVLATFKGKRTQVRNLRKMLDALDVPEAMVYEVGAEPPTPIAIFLQAARKQLSRMSDEAALRTIADLYSRLILGPDEVEDDAEESALAVPTHAPQPVGEPDEEPDDTPDPEPQADRTRRGSGSGTRDRGRGQASSGR